MTPYSPLTLFIALRFILLESGDFTFSCAGIVECGIDGVGLEDGLVPVNGVVERQLRWVVVTEVGVDALTQVGRI